MAALLVLGAGCAAQPAVLRTGSTGSSPSAPAPSAPAPAGTPTSAPAPPAAGSVFRRAFLNPDLTVADGSIYLTWWLAPPTNLPPRMALARASVATGQILAENDFGPGGVSVPVYAAGSLWVTTDSTSAGELLLRLDPHTLMVTGELQVAHRGTVSEANNHIAFAGNSIWVDGGNRLMQVSPRSVQPERVIALPHADSSAVGASPDGRTLLVSVANSGVGTIQRRNPRTGALIAASHVLLGVSAPVIGGVSGGVAWIAEPTGMMGYVERYQTAAMTPDAATKVEGTNGIRAGLWDGLLWVHGPAGGAATNYCAEPRTGRRLATLTMPFRSQPVLLGVGAKSFYYSYSASDNYRWRIAAAPIPAACTTRR